MNPYYKVTLTIDGLGEIFYARCHGPQLETTLIAACAALLSPSHIKWIYEKRARFNFLVELA